jgi:putative Holliday junction resolvase
MNGLVDRPTGISAVRYLAIDLGDKRTGVAVGDDDTRIVSPLEVIAAPRARIMEPLLDAIDEQGPGALVIGLPLNMDGTEGPQAQLAREFGNRLAAATKLPVHFQDERLSSYAAEEHLKGSGRTRKQKKQLRDALAAAEILRDFLDEPHA